jgi:hypothetical protein
MMGVFVAAVLAAGQTGAIQLASPGLQSVHLKADEVAFYSDHLAQQLTLRGVPVVTQSEIVALLGLERQKQLLGCSDAATSCVAELANALGADGIVTGSIGKFGGQIQINVKIIRLRDARTVALFSSHVATTELVLPELTRGAEQMAPIIREAFGMKAVEASSSGEFNIWPAILPAAVGVVGVGVGTGLFIAAASNDNRLRTAGVTSYVLTYDQATAMAAQEKTMQLAGIITMSVGAAALVTGVVLAIVTNQDAPSVAVTPTLGGAAIVGSF